MRPLHARYPFFAAARQAVESAEVAIATLVTEDAPAVERGVERVERALMEGTVEAEDPYAWDTQSELLSYPISRIIVSLVETPAAVDKYARAEADTAYERMLADFGAGDNDINSDARASLDDFLREFDLTDSVRAESTGNSHRAPEYYWVDVGPYLTYCDTDWGANWRLVNRSLADGAVRVARTELYELLREAVRRRVAEGLPFTVRGSDAGDQLADALKPHVERLRNLLSDRGAINVVYTDSVDPDHFPPCVEALLTRAQDGEALPNEAAFSLAAFLVGVGLSPEEVGGVVGEANAESLKNRATILADSSGSQYAPPTCETMQAYDLCVNRDDRCDTISHPMKYFKTATTDAESAATDEATGGAD
ncbi:DNA primase [Haloferax mediterranei ATCC 33500]|uniref:DNA primase large subunit PriL n=1 Tax=Haloferax mediterranei (strain ATCC 33500 / DSM 1411 / JCM 8866 / NBRC 14739 / NCIMB 2177 / R-4) TaxID=523841 RepID=I3R104_HALMT|nr:DNA primase large subunit PriL [Haloferax mediterranei]AFK17914.2 DNA primase large subunit [Haloferax mediterranei ATCC 33500]AHZ22662.1 DNA primase [Haloferax mediterranei ATCC 33500]EMA02811.1 DNA primase large subunit [Haloferax mediterranei ATCC 33500]MDX5988005.1 DNA primase large subunit PriL [Haloferax mediterranei ATCC 33500]QCQ76577.1 DNA primase [Haloferax mediterranei ATCC 33500]